jgi:hypothetical protein
MSPISPRSNKGKGNGKNHGNKGNSPFHNDSDRRRHSMPATLTLQEKKINDINSRRASLPANNIREDLRQSICKPGEVAGYIRAMNKLRRDSQNSAFVPSYGSLERESTHDYSKPAKISFRPRCASGEVERTISPKYHAERRNSVPTYVGISVAQKGPKGPDGSIGFKRRRAIPFVPPIDLNPAPVNSKREKGMGSKCSSEAQIFTLCLEDELRLMTINGF